MLSSPAQVSFLDESHDRLDFSADVSHVRSILRDGLVAGGLTFLPLAFSSSQLRSQSYLFFAPCDELSADDIRAWMGDFSAENASLSTPRASARACRPPQSAPSGSLTSW